MNVYKDTVYPDDLLGNLLLLFVKHDTEKYIFPTQRADILNKSETDCKKQIHTVGYPVPHFVTAPHFPSSSSPPCEVVLCFLLVLLLLSLAQF